MPRVVRGSRCAPTNAASSPLRRPAGVGPFNLNLYTLAIHFERMIMTAICKWGNSLGLRLPAPVAVAAGIKNGTHVSVRLLDNGSILVTPLSGSIVISGADLTAKVISTAEKW